jgi:D-alanine-D-alanine ligase
MTGHSLVPMAARVAGLSYEALCLGLLATTLENAQP